MCGILGFTGNVPESKWKQTYDILTALFLASEGRGQDATGFVARHEPFKNPLAASTVMDKQPGPASQFVRDNPSWRALRHRRCSTVLGHVRWATHGSPEDNRNNHPLVGHSGLYLVHNGVLENHRGIAEKHGLELLTDVDSELILRLVESAKHPAIGLDIALRRVEGSMAAVVYDSPRDALYMARDNDRPLWLLRMKDDRRWFFASTRAILLTAFNAVMGEDAIAKVETLMPLAAGHVLIVSGTRLISLPGR
jgi:glucosamine 6-phosphate synthetase-like amidotransferase/phosphosugar isomerase protein